MKARKIFLGLSALAMMAFVTGCSDDLHPEVNQGGDIGAEDGPGVYMSVNFSMPTGKSGTRSTTTDPNPDDASSDGVEIGKDYENNINEVLLVLAREDNGFIAASTVTKEKLTPSKRKNEITNVDEQCYNALAKFQLSSIDEFYQDPAFAPTEGAKTRKVRVFVFCNPNSGIIEAIRNLGQSDPKGAYGKQSWVDAIGEVDVTGLTTNGSIWSNANGGSFLMSNSRIATRLIPAELDDWKYYTKGTMDNCFHLSGLNSIGENAIDNTTENDGYVNVQRAAARIDFKDGSGSETPANTYHVYGVEKGDVKHNIVDVELTKMALVNMSRKYYYLKRVSNNGLAIGMAADGIDLNGSLCSPETPTNYVVGPNASVFQDKVDMKGYGFDEGSTSRFSFKGFFNYPFFNEDGKADNANMLDPNDRWGTELIAHVLGQPDKHPVNNWIDQDYHIWRYTTENVIPVATGSDPVQDQTNGISTGVVFKGKMKLADKAVDLLEGDEVDDLTKQLIVTLNRNDLKGDDSDPILYNYAGALYVTFESVRQAAINASFDWHYGPNNEVIGEWNRSNSLYEAVFGKYDEASGYGTGYEFTAPNGDKYTDKPYNPASPYGLWKKWQEDTKNNENRINFKKAVTGAGFTLYQTSEDPDTGIGYYCYYYHWIRHNDNSNNGIMGPMEFDVVRNNVYKLSVNAIFVLGHPRLTENDPNPPTPWTPDESKDIYMDVNSRVLPWVVRVNDIVFE